MFLGALESAETELSFQAELAFAVGTPVAVEEDDLAVELAWGLSVGVPEANPTEHVFLRDAVWCGEPVV